LFQEDLILSKPRLSPLYLSFVSDFLIHPHLVHCYYNLCITFVSKPVFAVIEALVYLNSPENMSATPRRKDGLLSKELNEPPQSEGMFEDIPKIAKVAGDYLAPYVNSSLFLSLYCKNGVM